MRINSFCSLCHLAKEKMILINDSVHIAKAYASITSMEHDNRNNRYFYDSGPGAACRSCGAGVALVSSQRGTGALAMMD